MVDKAVMNAFEVLGIQPTASKDEIKKAYKAMAKRCHPDLERNPQRKKEAEERFKMIQACYEYLMELSISEDDTQTYTNEAFTDFFDQNKQAPEDDYEELDYKIKQAHKGMFLQIINLQL